MKQETHYNLSDQEFADLFTDLKLDPSQFTHEAHLRLAWIHIHQYGIRKAMDTISNEIRQFAAHHGDPQKFNLTVTIAAARAVYHFILRSKSTCFRDFIVEFPQLKTKFRELLESHYSIDIFRSELARMEFIEPDIQPFDPIE